MSKAFESIQRGLKEAIAHQKDRGSAHTMSDCCSDKQCVLDQLRHRQSGTLRIVLAINALMFVVEFASGIMARSTALLSDSLDNFGDAATYAASLYAVSRSVRTKAKVALLKGGLILLAALFVFGQVARGLLVPGAPVFEAMGIVALLALIANTTCLVLLHKHRGEDVNMSSVYECSRNDIVSNLSVFAAAILVWLTTSSWPDLIVGFCLALLLLRSAVRVIRAASAQLHMPASEPLA
jgi:cation diffusion facilitator family transporter